MSLTEQQNVFAGVNETGVNDLLTAFFTARPQHLNYRTSPAASGSPPVPADPAAWTELPPIVLVPNTPHLEIALQFAIPQVDVHPESAPLPPPLALQVGDIAVRTTVRFGTLCGGKEHLTTELGLVAVAKPTLVALPEDGPGIAWKVVAVELVDIAPDPLEHLLECLLQTAIQGVLSTFAIPLGGLTKHFPLQVTRDPEAEQNEIQLYGDVV